MKGILWQFAFLRTLINMMEFMSIVRLVGNLSGQMIEFVSSHRFVAFRRAVLDVFE